MSTGMGIAGRKRSSICPLIADDREQAIDDALVDHPDNGEIVAAVVTAASPKQVKASFIDGNVAAVQGNDLRFVASALSTRAQPSQRIRPGAIVRLMKNEDDNWVITQLPQVEGAFVSVVPQDGAIRALVGGFDFNKNKFNHVTQAWRQPGSSFKPFIYSASLEKGLSPATIINDAPLYFSAGETGGQAWEPKNYGGGFDGPMPMRTALMKSKNLVSIRILNNIGTKYAQGYVTKFGFDAARQPAYLPMALGAGQVTPLQMATGYSVFANGGYRVNPYLIADITDPRGAVVSHPQPLVAGESAPLAITPRNAYVMNSLLQSVAQRGTGASTNQLKRTDLAGKTGTTNDSHDAWFAGYQHSLVAIAWIGYDSPRSLGDKETGGGLALPVWMDYMSRALRGVPEYKSTHAARRGLAWRRAVFRRHDAGPWIRCDHRRESGAAGRVERRIAGAPRPQVGEQEKQDIMNLFKGATESLSAAAGVFETGFRLKSRIGSPACSLAYWLSASKNSLPSRVLRHAPSTYL